ncbi:MAG: hypothetical protein HC822_20995 [Oscillochloris sp.]|nr:hypothetical protein [Oscillochloris sp.]
MPHNHADRERWYSRNWAKLGAPLLQLAARGCPPELIAEAVRRRLAAPLANYELPDPALYGWALSRMIGLASEDEWACNLIPLMLNRFSDAAHARTLLGPVLDAILELPREQRAAAIRATLEGIPAQPAPARSVSA